MLVHSLAAARKSATHFWDFLTRPSPSITDPQKRQHSRLLASMMLAATVAIFILIILSTHTSNTLAGADVWLVVSIGLLVILWIAYVLTRIGHYRFAVVGLLVSATAGLFGAALVSGGQSSYNSLFYLFAITVFASAFLSVQATVITAACQLLLLVIFSARFPQISQASIISGPLSFNAFLSVFILLLVYHQRRAIRESNNELAASEERYRLVTGLISDYAYSLRVTKDGNLLHEWITEDSFKRVTGYAHNELDNGNNVNLSLFLPEDEPQLKAELDHVLHNHRTTDQHRIRTKNGDIHWLKISRLPVWDANEQRVTRYYGVAQDVTERAQAEIALKESEERYKLLTEAISDFVLLYDVVSSRLVYISPSYERAVGFTLDELNTIPIPDHVHPEDAKAAEEALHGVAAYGIPMENVQYRARTKAGSYIWLEIYANPVTDAHGNVRQVIISARDVTSRKQTEMALKASEERYRIISELISDYAYFFRFNPDGTRKREWITDSVLRVTGYTPAEMPEDSEALAGIFYSGDINDARDDLFQLRQGNQLNREFQLITKQGGKRWLSVFRRPVWDDNHQQVVGYYGVAQDITERKQAELALQASEERYRILTELTSDYAYFFRVNPDGSQYREWITDSVTRVTGYTPEEMPEDSESLARIFAPVDVDRATREIARLKQGETVNTEMSLHTKDGAERWLSILRRPVWDHPHEQVIGYYGVAKDITDRKLAELALVDSERRYRKISELISDYAFYTRINPDGSLVREWITDSFFHVTGYLPSEIDAYGAPKLFHPESIAQFEADHERMMKGESTTNDYRIITKHGDIRWLHLIRQPAWDESHQQIVGYYGVARDVTTQKQAETQRMKLLLEQEQFVMVGHLVDALSHDFRTALATIETSRYLVERLAGDAIRPSIQPKLESIQRSVAHLAAQLEHLHMVSFLTGPSLAPSNLNYIIYGIMTDQLVRANQKHIHLLFNADESLPVLRIDVIKIEKAIRHLVANALTHTPDHGSVVISTRHTSDYAFIEVADTGEGIAADVIERIFEPFFRGDSARTVDKGGVGLGLTIVKMIVEAHGGSVTVHSTKGKGSNFVLSLPLREEIVASA